jgi:hypothetical protein
VIAVFLASASLAVGMPVTCEPAQNDVAGLYFPRVLGGPRIAIVEPWCDDVRRGTRAGAWVLAHEMGHGWQEAMGLPFDEGQADGLADRWWRVLQRLLGGRPQPPVVLGGRA